MPQIRHIAIHTSDPEQLAKFYVDVFGMTIRQTHPSNSRDRTVFLTDGYIEFALVYDTRAQAQGINHFGFTIEPSEKPEIYRKLSTYGIEPRPRPEERPYAEDRLADVQGNKIDISTGGIRLKP
jgi:catechol 2,3-dioxygenase-like lactoylglutathione lyase family enzyme